LAFFRPESSRREAEIAQKGYADLCSDISRYVEIEALDPDRRIEALYYWDDASEREKALRDGLEDPGRWSKGMPTSATGFDHSWLLDKSNDDE